MRAGDRDGELPAEELGADLVCIVQLHVGCLPVRAFRALPRCRYEPLSLLAGGLGDQLLGPEPEVTLGLFDADLVATLPPAVAELNAELQARVGVAAAGIGHALSALEHALDVDAHQCGRDDAEGRQCRVAAADRRLTCEDAHAARRSPTVRAPSPDR